MIKGEKNQDIEKFLRKFNGSQNKEYLHAARMEGILAEWVVYSQGIVEYLGWIFVQKSCLQEWCKLSKVSDHSRGWPEGSLFDSYYTKV